MNIRFSVSIFAILVFLFSNLSSQNLPVDPRFLKPMVDDNSKYTTTGNIGITITNYGTFGDGFVEQSPIDQPSCEYPKGSGIEHIFVGGLWVGGRTPAGTRVTTGAFNIPSLGGVNANFEFTNTAELTDRGIAS